MSKQNLKTLYRADGYGWYFKNAELLRQGKLKELESYLTLILLHILKWKYQPKKRIDILPDFRSRGITLGLVKMPFTFEQALTDNWLPE